MRQRIKDIIYFKTYAELKAESQRYYLGVLWWLIEPVIHMLVFYFVFAVLFNRGTEDFVVFLLTGLVFWQWFQSTVSQSADSLTSNRNLFGQVAVPKYLFPAVAMLKNTAKFSVVLVILLLFLMVYGIKPAASWLLTPLVLAVGGVFIAGMSLVVAWITPFIPDLRILVDNGMRVLLFLSGIFFDIDSFETPYSVIFEVNPVAMLIDNLRTVLLDGQSPDWWQLAGVLIFSAVVGAAGFAAMRASDSSYAKIPF